MKIDDILSRFPTREEVSKLVGLRQPQSGLQDEVLTMFGAFGAGPLAGRRPGVAARAQAGPGLAAGVGREAQPCQRDHSQQPP